MMYESPWLQIKTKQQQKSTSQISGLGCRSLVQHLHNIEILGLIPNTAKTSLVFLRVH